MNIVKRMVEIQKEMTKSQRSFELKIGKTSGYLNVLQKKNSIPGADVIAEILKEYPIYSALWLLTGEGEKYVADETTYPDMLKILDNYITKIVKREIEKI